MTPTTSALRKTAFVKQALPRAFELFTMHMADWWPLDTHSVGRAESQTVVLEPRVGGHIVETTTRGETAIWGTVLVWEPPAHVRFTWHPGTPPDEATEVDVTFDESPDGTTVELVHTGWDRRPDGPDARDNYDGGWDYVFGRFAAAGSGALIAGPDA